MWLLKSLCGESEGRVIPDLSPLKKSVRRRLRRAVPAGRLAFAEESERGSSDRFSTSDGSAGGAEAPQLLAFAMVALAADNGWGALRGAAFVTVMQAAKAGNRHVLAVGGRGD